KWVEVKITKDTSSTKTVELMRDVLATHGIPDTIVPDNGRNFVSGEFESFLSSNGIRHIRTAPYHPSSNGQAESNNKAGDNLVTELKVESGKRNRSFNTGDLVWTRNFGRGEKWLPGTVRNTGARDYEVDVGGDLQSRHVGQLRSRVISPTTAPREQNITLPIDIAQNMDSNREEDRMPTNTTANDSTPSSTNDEVARQQPERDVTTRSRPQRRRNLPSTIKDYLMGEEL
uniref:Integrase catalytic domain-containing protein n=1 Tax=Musca domestica TaxID=7370 RepID=A0A1I8NJ25_MUSDO